MINQNQKPQLKRLSRQIPAAKERQINTKGQDVKFGFSDALEILIFVSDLARPMFDELFKNDIIPSNNPVSNEFINLLGNNQVPYISKLCITHSSNDNKVFNSPKLTILFTMFHNSLR
jgi:hypothetical protein